MRKRALWLAAAAIVAVPAAALAVAVAVIDPNDLKPSLIRAVQQATGRTLTLGGPIEISPSLWPTIVVRDVQLANLPGGSRPDMAHAERIEAQLSLPALLSRRLEILKLTLIGPNILFEPVAGKPNWLFETDPAQSSDGQAGDKPAGASYTLNLRDVRVQNGMVTSRLPARTRVVGMRALRVQHPADGGPVTLDGVLVYGDNQPFSVQAKIDPAANSQWTTALQLAAFDSTVAASGTATLAGIYDLQVEGHSPALEKLNALLPEMQLPALRQASLSAHLSNSRVAGGIPVIGQTKLAFDSADLTGRLPGLTLGAMQISLPAAGGTAMVSGGFQWLGQPFSVTGGFGVPVQLDRQADVPLDLAAHTPPGPDAGSMTLKGKVSLDTLRFAGLDAEAGLQTADLAAFGGKFARSLPTLPTLHDVHAQAHLQAPAAGLPLTLKSARLQAREAEMSGDATLGAGQAVTAKLRSSRLDLDALLPASAPDAQPPGGTVISNAPLPWPQLHGPDLDVAAVLDAVTWQRQAWPTANVTVRLQSGVLETGKITLAMPAGPASLSLTANPANTTAALTIAAPGVPLTLIAHQAGLPGAVAGTLQIDASLHATGRSLHDLAASLDGTLSAASAGGQLSNAAFVQLTHASLDALGIHVPAEGDTTLRCLAVDARFNKGVGQVPLIALQTSYLHVEGVGQVDLGRETLALKLQPMAEVAGSHVAVPVVVEGPFRAIKGRLDASGLEQLGILFDGLFGGDKAGTCKTAQP